MGIGELGIILLVVFLCIPSKDFPRLLAKAFCLIESTKHKISIWSDKIREEVDPIQNHISKLKNVAYEDLLEDEKRK
ncbi:MAG: hypothetical protein JJV93_01100 [Alphaproteobacteria bacterium]|nr:hypothetical protein [Alphaproteobacteria bacterium]MBL0717847.1 hypothetical protein [Alphaproteobacteria bacterium]